MSLDPATGLHTRGTSNGNDRGSTESRRRRRVFLIETYASDVAGFARCYRCGRLVYNPDDHEGYDGPMAFMRDGKLHTARPMTVDRIIPGNSGGRYIRSNIRPACAFDNSSTGAKLAKRGKKR